MKKIFLFLAFCLALPALASATAALTVTGGLQNGLFEKNSSGIMYQRTIPADAYGCVTCSATSMGASSAVIGQTWQKPYTDSVYGFQDGGTTTISSINLSTVLGITDLTANYDVMFSVGGPATSYKFTLGKFAASVVPKGVTQLAHTVSTSFGPIMIKGIKSGSILYWAPVDAAGSLSYTAGCDQ